mmetsp:Transcript_57064/g.83736  ORF Transcript_57064/g.83736 Transcript_57064/m.83736 type:complete len:88 (-) Transcript_57064:130-393(-)
MRCALSGRSHACSEHVCEMRMARVRALVAHDVGWDVRIALDYFLLYGVIWGGRKGKWLRWKSSAGDAGGGDGAHGRCVKSVCVHVYV